MVRINGASSERRKRICAKCGAKLQRMNDQSSCPNIERADHKEGQHYSGRVRDL